MPHSKVDSGSPGQVFARTLIIGIISFLTLIDLFGSQALLPALTHAYATNPSTMGFVVNASTIGMAIAGLAVAYFSHHIDRRRGIWISLLLLSVPTSLLGVVDTIESFALLRMAQGVFMSAAFTLTMTFLAEECSPQEAAAAMAAYITGNVASNFLGRLMAANLAQYFGLSESFYIFAGLNVAGAVLVYFCLGQSTPRRTRSATPSKPLVIWMQHMSEPALRSGFLIGFLILFAFIGVFSYVNFVLVSAPFSLSQSALGLVYFVFLPSIFTTPLAGKMSGQFGVRQAFWISMGVALLGLVLLIPPYLPAVLAGLGLVAVGTFCAQAVATGFIGQAAQTDRAAASGLYLASYYLGGVVGSLVLGEVFERSGWAGCVLAVATAIALSCLLAVKLVLRRPVEAVTTTQRHLDLEH